jgi:hypothetical protein
MVWGFFSLEGNTSKLGLDLDDINLPYIKEKRKAFEASFFFCS